MISIISPEGSNSLLNKHKATLSKAKPSHVSYNDEKARLVQKELHFIDPSFAPSATNRIGIVATVKHR
jgi:hypothetical protein